MQQIGIAGLVAGTRVERTLYHLSGEVLIEAGVTLTPEAVGLLERSGIEAVVQPEPGEDVTRFLLSARNQMLPVSSLELGQKLDRPIFDHSGALLVEAGTEVTDRLSTSLQRRGVSRVYVRRSAGELRLHEVVAFRQSMRRGVAVRPPPAEIAIDQSRMIRPEECTVQGIDRLLDTLGSMSATRSGDPLLGAVQRHDLSRARPQEAKDGLMVFFDESVSATKAVFDSLCGNAEVNGDEIARVTRSTIGGLIAERDLLLNLNNVPAERDYLVSHSLAVTVLAIATAVARGFDKELVLEMAYAGYLHDIGMLRLPAQIVDKPGRLTQPEILQVRRHPVHSLDMLQTLVGRRTGVPRAVPIVAYQSHERENGSGYPKGRSGKLIHEFTKIVAACDAYQAMTSKRPWRDALLPYQAMEQIVLMGARRELDPEVVRAMLGSISLFPIGSWVELSDGARARVVGLAGSNYAKPVVSIMEHKGERMTPPARLNLAEHKDVEVVRPIPPLVGVIEAMEGF